MTRLVVLFLFLTGCVTVGDGAGAVRASPEYCAEVCSMWPGAKTIPVNGEECVCTSPTP